MKKIALLFLALLFADSVSATESKAIDMPKAKAMDEKPKLPLQIGLCHAEAFDKLMVGTRIFIRVLGHDYLSRETSVGPKGTVTIPMAGEVMAEGETTKSLAEKISQKLDEAYVITSGVEVEVIQYPPIYITGLVAKPGLYDYHPRLTVRQAVTLAGGFGPRARTSEVHILRSKIGNALEQQKLAGDEDSQVLPGDTIEVLRRWF